MENFCKAINCCRSWICDGLIYRDKNYQCKINEYRKTTVKFEGAIIAQGDLWDCLYITRDGRLHTVYPDTCFASGPGEIVFSNFYREPIKIIACFEKFKRQIENE